MDRKSMLRFINSKDIREYLEKIDYRFGTLEVAWIVYQCRDATIREKHEAWKTLIGTMPDCEIPKRPFTVPQKSLHEFLCRYMELQDKYIEQFRDRKINADASSKPYVYKFRYIHENGETDEFPTVFSAFDALFDLDFAPDKDVVRIECVKMRVDDIHTEWYAELTPSFEFLKVDPREIADRKEADTFFGVFDGLWFDFPTPFKKGDIVYDPYKSEGLHGDALVLTGVNLDGIESEQTKAFIKSNGDITDMNGRGYFFDSECGIYFECTENYMNLEYYRGTFGGASKVLVALSSFLKEQISEGLFAKAYHSIMIKAYGEKMVPYDYENSYLALAGINGEELK